MPTPSFRSAARRTVASLGLAVLVGTGVGSVAFAGGPSPVAGPDRPATAGWQAGRDATCRATTADLDGGCSFNRLH